MRGRCRGSQVANERISRSRNERRVESCCRSSAAQGLDAAVPEGGEGSVLAVTESWAAHHCRGVEASRRSPDTWGGPAGRRESALSTREPPEGSPCVWPSSERKAGRPGEPAATGAGLAAAAPLCTAEAEAMLPRGLAVQSRQKMQAIAERQAG